MYTKGIYKDTYKKSQRLDFTNKIISLTENKENQQIPYQQYSKVQLRLIDSPGDGGEKNIKVFLGMKALIIVYDITNYNTFKTISNNIENAKNIFYKSKNDIISEDKLIKQPDSFNEFPILIVGNKSDLHSEQKIKKSEVDEFIRNLKNENNFSLINYYEISVKENKGIDNIFQDIIFSYFKRKIYTTNQNINNNEINIEKKCNKRNK